MRAAIVATLAYALLAIPAGAQDTTRIKVQTDSIRRETCRGGRLSASGLTCTGAKQSPRVTVIRRLANRVDSLLRVTVPAPVPTPTPTPTPIPVPDPAPGGIAELPRIVPASRDPYPARLCSVTVPSGGSVTAALQSARGGQVVCLTPGVTYAAVTLPARAAGDTGWIVLRTSGALPPEGTRAKPSTAYATIQTANVECALSTTPGTFGWFIAGVRFSTAASSVNNPATYNIVCLGGSGTEQDTAAEIPQKIVLSRVVVDAGPLNVQNCVMLNSGSTAIVDSWLANCHWKGGEGHGIASYNGPGPYLIENNTIEAAGITVLFGGATPRIANLRASDITVRRNHLTKNPAWGPPGTGAGPWTEKNLLELKTANRVLIEENYLENSWQDAQPTGSGIMIKSINDEGNCSWCQTTDVTVRRNYGRNIETPIVISSAENYNNPAAPPPPVSRVLISSNVFDDAGAVNGSGWAFQLTSGHGLGAVDVQVERTVIAQGAGKLLKWGLVVDPFRGATRAVFRDNVWAHGDYPVLNGEGGFGDAALNIGAPGAVWSNMYFVKAPNHTSGTPVPTGTIVVTSEPTLAATIRAAVTAAVSGVVVPP